MRLQNVDLDEALKRIVEGTASATGSKFFAALVMNLCKALHTHGAWVTEYLEDARRLRALAFWLGGKFVPEYEYDITGTPCENVIDKSQLVHVPERVVELYPQDPDLKPFGAVSYMGVPLTDVDGSVMGHLAVLDTRPLPHEPRTLALFRIFAARAAAELQRLRAEAQVRENEQKLSRLVDSAMDAIVELNREFTVTRCNPAAGKVFKCVDGQITGRNFRLMLQAESRGKLTKLIDELDRQPQGQQYLWVPGGLETVCDNGESFLAEATLSRYKLRRQPFYTLILRNIQDRLVAEQKIQSLTTATRYLQEEIKSLHNFENIIGHSKPMLALLNDLNQVAGTDATVLVLGETGTGQELIARAVHAASSRSDMPLIKVNCAAMSATLIESELFGHEKGAFTGATARREGRFALAHGGSIFLDEIGELPPELQVKLLRVLQEGEFEPVGSSKTQKVDVRVIAATNRDLQQEVKEGRFREDLFYRLNVFPLQAPPLRERGDDIILLATAFARKSAQKIGRSLQPLTAGDQARLKAYDWPGNVRELQNVIERAVITARDGRLNLDRALPETAKRAIPLSPSGTSAELSETQIRTAQELLDFERQNLLKALEACNWKVAGSRGAASLLGIPPSTLSSRMKTLGIRRPR